MIASLFSRARPPPPARASYLEHLIRPTDSTEGPVRTLEAVECATLTWVDWFNTRRLLGPLGDIPPAEFEAQYYAHAAVA